MKKKIAEENFYYWKKPDGNEDKMKEKDIYLRKCELHIDTKMFTINTKLQMPRQKQLKKSSKFLNDLSFENNLNCIQTNYTMT